LFGSIIFLSVLFACTLPESDLISNTVQSNCTYTALNTSSGYCCEHHWSTCSGCTLKGKMNGKCDAVQRQLRFNPQNLQSGENSRTECCDGRCCSEHSTECDTCVSQHCSTNSQGSQSCTQVTQQCNCVTVCVAYSTRQGSINCGTCHHYKAGFSFVMNGVVHQRMKTMKCGLDTSTGLDDHGCQGKVVSSHSPGTSQTCWVHKKTLEVYWEEPAWSAGCWAGITIGGLMLLIVAVVGLSAALHAACGSSCDLEACLKATRTPFIIHIDSDKPVKESLTPVGKDKTSANSLELKMDPINQIV